MQKMQMKEMHAWKNIFVSKYAGAYAEVFILLFLLIVTSNTTIPSSQLSQTWICSLICHGATGKPQWVNQSAKNNIDDDNLLQEEAFMGFIPPIDEEKLHCPYIGRLVEVHTKYGRQKWLEGLHFWSRPTASMKRGFSTTSGHHCMEMK